MPFNVVILKWWKIHLQFFLDHLGDTLLISGRFAKWRQFIGDFFRYKLSVTFLIGDFLGDFWVFYLNWISGGFCELKNLNIRLMQNCLKSQKV